MKICTKCNAQNTNESKMCNQCGAPLPDQIYPDMPNQTQQIIVQKPKKSHGCLIAFIIVLVAVIALISAISIIAVSVSSDKDKDNSKATINNSSTSSSSVVEDEETEETVYNIGDTASIGNWNITVSDSQIVDRIDTDYGVYYSPNETGNKYVKLSVTAYNSGTEADRFLPTISGFEDYVSVKLLYGESEFVSSNLLESFDMHDSTIQSMSSKDGLIAFSIPSAVYDGADPITLEFKYGSDTVTFKLR